MEAIVLAGGFGTRLKSVISDVPKPMAPIGGEPFLAYIVNYLLTQHVTKIILSTGYMHEAIEGYFTNEFNDIEIQYAREFAPLGTGGAIKSALTLTSCSDVYILNGDTYFMADLDMLRRQHLNSNAVVTLSLKPMDRCERYGVVEVSDGIVKAFHEKGHITQGLINGGVYLVNKQAFLKHAATDVFSFEKDFLEKHVHTIAMHACVFDRYFIDIGVPEDYFRAQSELTDDE